MKNRWIELVTFLLMAATVIAGFLTTTDTTLLPAGWRPYLPLVIGGIILLKQLAYGILDFMDDGQLNKSYKAPTSLLRVLALMLLPMLLMSSCTTGTSGDPEMERAEAAVTIARSIVLAGELANTVLVSDPKSTPVQRMAAEAALNEARERLKTAEKRLADLQAKRAAAAVAALPSGGGEPPASTILPPLTATK